MKKEDAEEFTQSLGQIVGGSWRQIALAKRLGVPEALGLTIDRWVSERLGGYVKMNVEDRREAAKELAAEGQSTREIAEVLGRNHATIARDLAVANATRTEPDDKISAIGAAMSVANATVNRDETHGPQHQRDPAPLPSDGVTTDDLQSLADDQFGAIYADPPWQYGNQGTRAAQGNHYGGMTIDDICALPIGRLAQQRSHLHLWTTNAFLFDARRVMEAWGFEYKSCFVWVKPQMGIGNYWRVSHEFMLLGVRGSLPFRDKSLMSWASIPRTKHSEKPEHVRRFIERASPGPYLELFARLPSVGWTCWGNEISREIFAA